MYIPIEYTPHLQKNKTTEDGGSREPKRGEIVQVRNRKCEEWVDRIYLTNIKGYSEPYFCVNPKDNGRFHRGGIFGIESFMNMRKKNMQYMYCKRCKKQITEDLYAKINKEIWCFSCCNDKFGNIKSLILTAPVVGYVDKDGILKYKKRKNYNIKREKTTI